MGERIYFFLTIWSKIIDHVASAGDMPTMFEWNTPRTRPWTLIEFFGYTTNLSCLVGWTIHLRRTGIVRDLRMRGLIYSERKVEYAQNGRIGPAKPYMGTKTMDLIWDGRITCLSFVFVLFFSLGYHSGRACTCGGTRVCLPSGVTIK